MSITGNPLQKSPERAFALQKYLLLHSQHDALQEHIQSITTSTSAITSAGSSRSSSLSLSPPSPTSLYSFSQHSRNHRRSSTASYSPTSLAPISELPSSPPPPSSQPEPPKRRSSYPVTADSEAREEAIAEGEMKLLNVNQQIKATLTELLNCESVRGDRKYRTWVQTRLMEAERELKGSRRCGRRRSIDVQMVKFK